MSPSPGRIFNPYPGLRPFREEESHLFFGRAEQVDELLGSLRRSRFVAVMGPSGSGKSSLVAAGLYPALHGGLAPGMGSRWAIASLRPGANPIRNMASALASQPELANVSEEPILAPARIEATLRASALGLSDLASTALADEDGHILVVVDQFEELFRYEQAGLGRASDASAFVQLLLEASRSDAPIEVIVTMRSDFLGDCAQYRELPETINDGLYLVPRLTRSQMREAMSAPAAVGGARLAPRLVQRVLNDAGSDPDALPLVQHALMRTWDLWEERGILDVPLDLDLYAAAGGVDNALSRHADEAFAELGDDDIRRVAEVMFKRLTEIGKDGRETRRPTSVEEIRAVAGSTRQEVEEVVEVFGRPGRSFVTVSDDDVVDISHESLIRQWARLRTWAREEARSRDEYQRLADAAERWEMGEAALLRDPDLKVASIWWEDTQPNEAWADRYDPSFKRASGYLEKSRSAATRRRVLSGLGVVGLGVVAVLFALLAVRATRAENRAELQEHIAVARLLAAESAGLGVDNRELSILSALAALAATGDDNFRVPEAEEALRSAMADPLGTPLPAGPGLQRLEGPVKVVAFSPDGRWLVTGGDDPAVLLWDVTSPSTAPTSLAGHEGWIVAAAFSPDGRQVATADDSGLVLVRNIGTPGEQLRITTHNVPVQDLAFSPDGAWLATAAADDAAWLHAVDDPTVDSARLSHRGFVYDVEFSPNGEFLATGSGDGTAVLWEVDELANRIPLHEGSSDVVAVVFEPTGERVVVGTDAGIVRVVDVSGNEVLEVDTRAPLASLAVSADGGVAATGGHDGIVRVWDLITSDDTSTPIAELPLTGTIDEVAIDDDLRWLVAGGPENAAAVYAMSPLDDTPQLLAGPVLGFDLGPDGMLAVGSSHGSVRLWNLDDLSTTPFFFTTLDEQGRNARVYSMAFSNDGAELATGTDDNALWRWRVDDPEAAPQVARRQVSGEFPDASINAVAYSGDGQWLATGSGDHIVEIYDRNSAGDDPDTEEFDEAVISLAFSPDSRWMAVGLRDDEALLVDMTTSARRRTPLTAHNDDVTDVAFNPASGWLAVSSQDGTTSLWNLDDPTAPVEILGGHAGVVSSVAFSPDGSRLATGDWDGTVLLWDLDDLTASAQTLAHDAQVVDIAWRPDGQLLGVALDGSFAGWDLSAPEIGASAANPAHSLNRAPGGNRVAFSPDGRLLATIGGDGSAGLWMQLEDLMDLACSKVGRNPSVEEWESIMPGEAPPQTCRQWPSDR